MDRFRVLPGGAALDTQRCGSFHGAAAGFRKARFSVIGGVVRTLGSWERGLGRGGAGSQKVPTDSGKHPKVCEKVHEAPGAPLKKVYLFFQPAPQGMGGKDL